MHSLPGGRGRRRRPRRLRGGALRQQPARTPACSTRALLVVVLVTVLVSRAPRPRGARPRERWSFAPGCGRCPGRCEDLWWVQHHTRIGGGAGPRARRRPAPRRHRGVPPLPLQPGARLRPARPLPHRAHRVDRPALPRPVRLPRLRGDDAPTPSSSRSAWPSRPRCWLAAAPQRVAAVAGRGTPALRMTRALPGRHHPGPRRGRAVAAGPTRLHRDDPSLILLPRQRWLGALAGVASAPTTTCASRSLALAVIVVARIRAQRHRPHDARRPRQRGRGARPGPVPDPDQADRLRHSAASSPAWPAACSAGCSCRSTPTAASWSSTR